MNRSRWELWSRQGGHGAVRVQELFDLTGQVALVTGGSRGLGYQMATALAEAGAKVAITARKEHELLEAASRLRKEGFECLPVVCDISKFENIGPTVERVVEHFGKIDILVNNAGMTWKASPEDITLEEWQRVVDTNLTGTFFMAQAVGRVMIRQGHGGRIINVASVAGLRGNDPAIMDTIVYNTTKAAVINMTRDLAVKWGRYGIHVNCIAPGFFATKMTRVVLERVGDRIRQHNPLGKIGGEDDLKGVTVLLASRASNFITGQVFVVDGGSSAK